MKKRCRGAKGRFVKCSSKSTKSTKKVVRRQGPNTRLAPKPRSRKLGSPAGRKLTLPKSVRRRPTIRVGQIGFVTTYDGNHFRGKIMKYSAASITLKLDDGRLQAFHKNNVKHIKFAGTVSKRSPRRAGRASGIRPLVTSSYSLRKGADRIVFSYFDRDETGPLIRMYSTKRIDGQNVDKILTQRQAQNKIADLQIYGWR